jgi:hypothetical protein
VDPRDIINSAIGGLENDRAVEGFP